MMDRRTAEDQELFAERKDMEASKLAAGSVGDNSRELYHRAFVRWQDYLQLRAALVVDGVDNSYLQRCVSEEQRTALLTGFMAYLSVDSRGNKASTVSTTLVGVKFFFTLAGHATNIFTGDAAARARQGCIRRDADNGRNLLVDSEKLPFPLELVLLACADAAPVDGDAATFDLLRWAQSTCLVMGYFGTMRVSNYIRMAKTPKHPVTAASVKFVYRVSESAEDVVEYAAHELLHVSDGEELLEVYIFARFSKGDRKGQGRTITIAAAPDATRFCAARHLQRWARAVHGPGTAGRPAVRVVHGAFKAARGTSHGMT